MRRTTLLKTFLLLCALVVGNVSAWAATSTLTFTAACGGSGTADDGATWTVTSDGTESTFDATSGIHYGTSNAKVTYIQLTTSGIGGTITRVVVNARDAQEQATVSVTVGGTSFTCSGSTTATNASADYVFTGSGSGNIVVRVDRGSSMKKAIYVKSVAVTYSLPPHKARFIVNGSTYQELDVPERDDITFPENLPAMGGKTFVGWVDTPIEGTTDTKPDFVTSATMGTSDITYYAVFANEFATIGTITDVLTRATTEVTGGNYMAWSDKTSNSNAVYAGNSAASGEYIQLRSNNSNSGIITTASGGKAKKITVVWDSSTPNGRTLNVYGKNTAYSAATNLYNSTDQGTQLGTIVYGTSTELAITGDYEYIGLRSNSGAMYLTSISIEWEGETTGHDGYCTTIPAPTAVVSAAGWATWNAPCAVSFPEGVNAYLVTVNSDPTKVSLIEVSDVPANTPVLLEGAADTYTMNVIESSTTSTADNLLRVSTGTNSGTMYVLAKIDEVVGFYMWDPSKTLPEGKIYLEMPGSVRPFIALPGEETGISDMNRETVTNNRYFDLQGRRVAQPTKGMYIVNGKKVVVK